MNIRRESANEDENTPAASHTGDGNGDKQNHHTHTDRRSDDDSYCSDEEHLRDLDDNGGDDDHPIQRREKREQNGPATGLLADLVYQLDHTPTRHRGDRRPDMAGTAATTLPTRHDSNACPAPIPIGDAVLPNVAAMSTMHLSYDENQWIYHIQRQCLAAPHATAPDDVLPPALAQQLQSAWDTLQAPQRHDDVVQHINKSSTQVPQDPTAATTAASSPRPPPPHAAPSLALLTLLFPDVERYFALPHHVVFTTDFAAAAIGPALEWLRPDHHSPHTANTNRSPQTMVGDGTGPQASCTFTEGPALALRTSAAATRLEQLTRRCLFETPQWRQAVVGIPPSSLALQVQLRNPREIPARLLRSHGSRAFDWSGVVRCTGEPLGSATGLSEATMFVCNIELKQKGNTSTAAAATAGSATAGATTQHAVTNGEPISKQKKGFFGRRKQAAPPVVVASSAGASTKTPLLSPSNQTPQKVRTNGNGHVEYGGVVTSTSALLRAGPNAMGISSNRHSGGAGVNAVSCPHEFVFDDSDDASTGSSAGRQRRSRQEDDDAPLSSSDDDAVGVTSGYCGRCGLHRLQPRCASTAGPQREFLSVISSGCHTGDEGGDSITNAATTQMPVGGNAPPPVVTTTTTTRLQRRFFSAADINDVPNNNNTANGKGPHAGTHRRTASHGSPLRIPSTGAVTATTDLSTDATGRRPSKSVVGTDPSAAAAPLRLRILRRVQSLRDVLATIGSPTHNANNSSSSGSTPFGSRGKRPSKTNGSPDGDNSPAAIARRRQARQRWRRRQIYRLHREPPPVPTRIMMKYYQTSAVEHPLMIRAGRILTGTTAEAFAANELHFYELLAPVLVANSVHFQPHTHHHPSADGVCPGAFSSVPLRAAQPQAVNSNQGGVGMSVDGVDGDGAHPATANIVPFLPITTSPVVNFMAAATPPQAQAAGTPPFCRAVPAPTAYDASEPLLPQHHHQHRMSVSILQEALTSISKVKPTTSLADLSEETITKGLRPASQSHHALTKAIAVAEHEEAVAASATARLGAAHATPPSSAVSSMVRLPPPTTAIAHDPSGVTSASAAEDGSHWRLLLADPSMVSSTPPLGLAASATGTTDDSLPSTPYQQRRERRANSRSYADSTSLDASLLADHYNTAPSAIPARGSTRQRKERKYDHRRFVEENNAMPFRVPQVYFLLRHNRGDPSFWRYVCCGSGSGTVVAIGLEDMIRAGFNFDHARSEALSAKEEVSAAASKSNLHSDASEKRSKKCALFPRDENKTSRSSSRDDLPNDESADHFAARFPISSAADLTKYQSYLPAGADSATSVRRPVPFSQHLGGLECERQIAAVLRGAAYLHSMTWGRHAEPVMRHVFTTAPIPVVVHRLSNCAPTPTPAANSSQKSSSTGSHPKTGGINSSKTSPQGDPTAAEHPAPAPPFQTILRMSGFGKGTADPRHIPEALHRWALYDDSGYMLLEDVYEMFLTLPHRWSSIGPPAAEILFGNEAIVHGDMHYKNVGFRCTGTTPLTTKPSRGKATPEMEPEEAAAVPRPLQACFLDFQSVGFGSIAAEVLYFLCTSVPVEVREEDSVPLLLERLQQSQTPTTTTRHSILSSGLTPSSGGASRSSGSVVPDRSGPSIDPSTAAPTAAMNGYSTPMPSAANDCYFARISEKLALEVPADDDRVEEGAHTRHFNDGSSSSKRGGNQKGKGGAKKRVHVHAHEDARATSSFLSPAHHPSVRATINLPPTDARHTAAGTAAAAATAASAPGSRRPQQYGKDFDGISSSHQPPARLVHGEEDDENVYGSANINRDHRSHSDDPMSSAPYHRDEAPRASSHNNSILGELWNLSFGSARKADTAAPQHRDRDGDGHGHHDLLTPRGDDVPGRSRYCDRIALTIPLAAPPPSGPPPVVVVVAKSSRPDEYSNGKASHGVKHFEGTPLPLHHGSAPPVLSDHHHRHAPSAESPRTQTANDPTAALHPCTAMSSVAHLSLVPPATMAAHRRWQVLAATATPPAAPMDLDNDAAEDTHSSVSAPVNAGLRLLHPPAAQTHTNSGAEKDDNDTAPPQPQPLPPPLPAVELRSAPYFGTSQLSMPHFKTVSTLSSGAPRDQYPFVGTPGEEMAASFEMGRSDYRHHYYHHPHRQQQQLAEILQIGQGTTQSGRGAGTGAGAGKREDQWSGGAAHDAQQTHISHRRDGQGPSGRSLQTPQFLCAAARSESLSPQPWASHSSSPPVGSAPVRHFFNAPSIPRTLHNPNHQLPLRMDVTAAGEVAHDAAPPAIVVSSQAASSPQKKQCAPRRWSLEELYTYDVATLKYYYRHLAPGVVRGEVPLQQSALGAAAAGAATTSANPLSQASGPRAQIPMTEERFIREFYILARHWAGVLMLELTQTTPQKRRRLKTSGNQKLSEMVVWAERTARRAILTAASVFAAVDRHWLICERNLREAQYIARTHRPALLALVLRYLATVNRDLANTVVNSNNNKEKEEENCEVRHHPQPTECRRETRAAAMRALEEIQGDGAAAVDVTDLQHGGPDTPHGRLSYGEEDTVWLGAAPVQGPLPTPVGGFDVCGGGVTMTLRHMATHSMFHQEY